MPWPKLILSRSASRAASVISRAARWPAFILDVSIKVPGSSVCGAIFPGSFTLDIIILLLTWPNDELRRSSLVKCFLFRCQTLQEGAGGEARLTFGEALHFCDHFIQAHGVGIP